MELYDIAKVRELMRRYGFSASKGLGQNFLISPVLPGAIADASGLDDCGNVLEVGPGIGTLSLELAKRAKRVAAVELDKRLLPVLSETLAGYPNVTVVQGDILKTDIPALCRRCFGEEPAVACANLPYYITAPAVSALLESGCFRQVTVMVQKEVADRLCAQAGGADYGAFTLYVGYYAFARRILKAPSHCFYPAPNVDSAVVALEVYERPPVAAEKRQLFQLIRAAFSTRRKTLLNCLYSRFSGSFQKEALADMIRQAGVAPDARGETLSLQQFDQLWRVMDRYGAFSEVDEKQIR